jgi:hypothetical protein
MKNLSQLCAGLILTLALTATASAGQMDCPGVTASSSRARVAGEIPNDVTAAGDIQYGVTAADDIPNGVTTAGEMPNDVTIAGDIPFNVTLIALLRFILP